MRDRVSHLPIPLLTALALGSCAHNAARCKDVQPGRYVPVGVYHVVDRWSGSGPFRAACDAFLQAAGFSFPANEVY
jgi:hypothetical protein